MSKTIFKVYKKGNFITSKSDASEEEDIITADGVGEILAVFVENGSVSVAEILGDFDDADDAENIEIDYILEYLGEEND